MIMKYKIAEIKNIDEIILLLREVIERLNSINLPLWNDEYPSLELMKEDIVSGGGRIVVHDDQIIAYAHIGDSIEEYGKNVFIHDNLYSISRLMVRSGYENQGVATYLIKKIEEEVKSLNRPGLGIMVHPINKKAIKLYEKLGFVFENKKEYEYGEYSTYSYLFK